MTIFWHIILIVNVVTFVASVVGAVGALRERWLGLVFGFSVTAVAAALLAVTAWGHL